MEALHAHRGMLRMALVTGALLATCGPLAPRTHAAGPSPVVQAVHSMYAARSFRLHFSFSAGLGNAIGDSVYVRQGTVFAFYVKMTTKLPIGGAAGRTLTIEALSTPTQYCMRQNQHGTWMCSHTALGGATLTPSAQELQQAASTLKQVTALGTKTVQGQLCRGYQFADTSTGKQTGGRVDTLWISAATQRPVQLIIGSPSTGGSLPTATTTTMTWSDWNDPSLKIPAA